MFDCFRSDKRRDRPCLPEVTGLDEKQRSDLFRLVIRIFKPDTAFANRRVFIKPDL